MGYWNLSSGSPSCQLHCQLFLDCVVEYKVTVFFGSKLNSSSVTLSQASKQCALLRLALFWSCCLSLPSFLMWQEIFLLWFLQMYCCFPLRFLRPRHSSGIGQMLSYPLSGKQKCHYRLLCSYQSSKHSFDFCNGRRNDSNEHSVDAADGWSNTYLFFNILFCMWSQKLMSLSNYICIFHLLTSEPN